MFSPSRNCIVLVLLLFLLVALPADAQQPLPFADACAEWMSNQARFKARWMDKGGEVRAQVVRVETGDKGYWLTIRPYIDLPNSQVGVELSKSLYFLHLPNSASRRAIETGAGDTVRAKAVIRGVTQTFTEQIVISGGVTNGSGSIGGGTIRTYFLMWELAAPDIVIEKTRAQLEREIAQANARRTHEQQEQAARLEALKRPERLRDALIDAASAGDLGKMQAALEQGADVNGQGEFGTPLIAAIESGRFRAVRFLLRLPPVDVNRKMPNGRTALLTAMTAGDSDILKLLEAAGAKLD